MGKRRRGRAGLLVGIFFVFAVLALSNPKMDDFERYVQKRLGTSAGSDGGTIGDVIAAGAKGITSVLTQSLYERRDYVIFSIFTPVIDVGTGRYLGLLKVAFIEL